MGLRGMFLSVIAVVVGAIMYWALTAQSSSIGRDHGFRFSGIGMILMIAGGAGFVTCAAIFIASRGSVERSTRTMDSHTIDPRGSSTTVHEEQH